MAIERFYLVDHINHGSLAHHQSLRSQRRNDASHLRRSPHRNHRRIAHLSFVKPTQQPRHMAILRMIIVDSIQIIRHRQRRLCSSPSRLSSQRSAVKTAQSSCAGRGTMKDPRHCGLCRGSKTYRAVIDSRWIGQWAAHAANVPRISIKNSASGRGRRR